MIRVLHTCGPEDARRRLLFLGTTSEEADRLCAELRSYLLSVPAGETSRILWAHLSGKGVRAAWGGRRLLFSVSSPEQVGRWIEESPELRSALFPVREAIVKYMEKDFIVSCRGKEIRLGGVPRIMGILNVTPDSFSDGGKYLSIESAVRRGIGMAESGAEIIDVGGESTRPGSSPVAADEEISRVVPVIRELSQKTKALFSVDTTKAAVAREAVAAGACIVNDTSALSDDPELAAFVAGSGCAVVLMHRRGAPATMQRSPSYQSFFDEMLDELSERMEAAEAAGIPRERILVDPGVGFGKRLQDNLALHRHLPDLRNLGRPIVFGPSRKSFLGMITGKEAEERAFGTAASVAVSVMHGADILRVHDVPEMKDAIRVATAIREGEEC